MSSESINHRVSGSHRLRRGARRPATVLVFVMALLGILFVMGISFVTLTQFESRAIDSERERSLSRRSADGLFQEMGRVLQEGLGGPFSLSGAGDERVAFAEMPGVHNTFSPIEPYVLSLPSGGTLIFGGLTDLEGHALGDETGAYLRNLLPVGLDTALANGYPDIPNGVLPADADGDGVVDSLAVDVRKLKLFSNSQMSVLAPALNADSNPAGAVYLAVRILPHGGLVDLNHAHPSLIKKALDLNYLDGVSPANPQGSIHHRPSQDHIGYTPALEEVGLRRRNSLPARSLAPSALMGNPFLDPDSFTYGDADMYPILLSPGSSGGMMAYQTVYEDNHRYWPIDPLEPFYPGAPEGPLLWAVRMEPETSYAEDDTFDEYDQRHLVTTISHDDLLSRGVDVAISDGDQFSPTVATRDLMDMMATANFVGWGGSPDECRTGENSFDPDDYTDSSWFELPNYPHTLPNGYDKNADPMSWCKCVESDSECRLNARKGRLRLSLPWLDEAIKPQTGVFDGPHQMERAHRLVQEVFTMLLLNARNTSTGGATEIWGKESTATTGPFWVPDTDEISFAAASMTANLFDYMDDDDTPTRVLLRSSDFSPPPCDSFFPCDQFNGEGACLADGFCERDPTAGKPLAGPGGDRYAYGIEAQPYITEIATVTAGENAPPAEAGDIIGFGIELYNPYPRSILLDKYSIVAFNPALTTFEEAWFDTDRRITMVALADRNAFTVVRGGVSGLLPAIGPGVLDTTVPPTFIESGFHVYLVREADVDDDQNTPDVLIVVDEFAIEGLQLGVDSSNNNPPQFDELWSTERSNVAIDEDMGFSVGPWFAPVPALSLIGLNNLPNGSLGGNNSAGPNDGYDMDDDTRDPGTAMVEAVVGNAGGFASAFPTTGSMLMVMRYANRGVAEFEYNSFQLNPLTPLAFTAHLDDVVQVLAPGSPPSLVAVPGREQVDNGRMPVFDIKGAHRLPASGTAPNQPGDLQRLPWGQLVFDYFTALPLSNLGPYEFNSDSGVGACCQGSFCFSASGESECDDAGGIFAGPGTVCGQVACGTLRDQPKVDLDGLRVHGRININAAPWKVLAGLPMMRAAAFDFLADSNNPADTQEKLVAALGLGAEAEPIGEQVAMAIVAYRELRGLTGLTGGGGVTGNYNTKRGWNLVTPSQRRGSGFMSVGELANVWHSSGGADFQIFPGGLTSGDKDFVRYASRLIAMGDWMTARSHVFTVYGLLLGDEDQTITVPGDETEEQKLRTEDVLSRAVRFQETVDRLGTFTGDPLPRRIGERVLVGYTDTQND